MTTQSKVKAERIDLRLSRPTKVVLQQAAAARNKSLSEFLLDSGLAAAAEALADRREFALTARQYDAFVAALDAPARPKPRLRKLLESRSALE